MNKNAKHHRYALWGGRVLFFLYIAGLCYFLFFAENYGRTMELEHYRYNLVPLKEIERFWKYRKELGIHSFYNLAGNILAFVPAGFFLPVLWKNKRGFLFTVCVTFQMSLLVELLQLISRVGSFDVDDLLLNTLGGAVGYLILTVITKWRKHETI